MNLLFLTSSLPYPAHGGGALRVMGLLEGVVAEGHQVDLLAFSAALPAADSPLWALCRQIQVIAAPPRTKSARLRTLLFSRQADMQTRFWSEDFAEALQKQLAEGDYDAVHFQSLEMGVYLAGARPYTRAKLIYDAYNAEAELQRAVYLSDRRYLHRWPAAFYSWIQARRLGRFERALCQGADATLAVSSEDQALLQALAGDKKVYLVNNGVKVADYARPIDPLPLQQPALVFTGTMDYRPNVDAALWFAESILPRLAEGHFYIVGGHPPPSVQALASSPNITVTGRVPEVIPYVQGGTVFVVPLRVGSGTRLKLLQALASGCAVVSTRVGSAGLPLQDGRELLLADTAEAFAAAIQRLYDDPPLRQRLGQQGQAFVAEHFDWRVLIPRLLAVYADLGL